MAAPSGRPNLRGSPGWDAHIGQVVLGGDRRHSRLGPVAAGHPDHLGAPVHRRSSQRSDVLPGPDQQRLDAPIPAEAEEFPPTRLPSTRDGIDDEDEDPRATR